MLGGHESESRAGFPVVGSCPTRNFLACLITAYPTLRTEFYGVHRKGRLKNQKNSSRKVLLVVRDYRMYAHGTLRVERLPHAQTVKDLKTVAAQTINVLESIQKMRP